MAARFMFLGNLARKANNKLPGTALSSWQCARNISLTSKLLDAVKVKMPSLSPTMYEGSIVQWLKKEGDVIAAGDVICEIQTDKAMVGFEMEEDGILAKILKPDNSTDIKIGTVIALMVEEGEDWQNVEIPSDLEPAEGTAITVTSSQAPTPTATPILATSHHNYGPAVRGLLDLYSINAADVQGTGPHNRLLKGDLLKYIKAKNLKPVTVETAKLPQAIAKPAAPATQSMGTNIPKPQPAGSPIPQPPVKQPTAVKPTVLPDGATYVDKDLTNMRKTIAKRLTESKISTPHAYSTIDCNIGQLVDMRKEFVNEGIKVSMNDFIIKAVAVSLQRVPEVNAVWTGDGGRVLSNIDISIAVATDSGLITPIIKDAIGLGVEGISKTIRELAGRAREGRLKPDEFQGGTFTISNLGMFGVSEFTAVINPPQACIMAVGASRVELSPEGTPQTYMKVTLSADARIVDEFLANKFLETFKEVLENPMLMLSQVPKVDMQKLFAK